MKFEWDETKRRTNLHKHRIDFKDCPTIFAGYTRTLQNGRFDYHEQRFITTGMLNGRIVVVAHTETSDTIRIISARKATRHEQQFFFQGLPD